MPIDLDEVFSCGGVDLIEVLNYCVRSVQMDPIFAFLVAEYRLSPTAARAIALYDMFLAGDAPARINAAEYLPPRELGLQVLVGSFRGGSGPALKVQPGKFVFDAVALHVRKNPRGAFTKIKGRYNPKLNATRNLPGGKMTIGQMRFVEQIWQRRVRPALVAAGFRRIANVA